jgi:hypothetical protein
MAEPKPSELLFGLRVIARSIDLLRQEIVELRREERERHTAQNGTKSAVFEWAKLNPLQAAMVSTLAITSLTIIFLALLLALSGQLQLLSSVIGVVVHASPTP